MMRPLPQSLLVSMLALIFCCSSQNEAKSATPELSVVTETLPPLNYEEDGTVTGFATDLLREILAEANLDATITLFPWTRAYQLATTRPNTIIYSTARTPEREHMFFWIGPISARQIYLYKLRTRKDIHVTSLSDAARYRLGMVRDMASNQIILNSGLFSTKLIDLAPSQESNMRKLLVQRVDLIVSLDWSAAFVSKSLGHSPSELEQLLLVDSVHPLYFAMNIDSDPALVQRLTKAFDKVKAKGSMDRLKHKYLQ